MDARHIGFAIVACGLAACAAQDTKLYAQEKEYVPPQAEAPWKINGEFDKEEYTVAISINGENVIRSRFPPYTPRLTAEGQYDGRSVQTLCMFSTDVIAGRNSGFELQLAQAIVAKTTRTGGNTCEVQVEGQPAATLYF